MALHALLARCTRSSLVASYEALAPLLAQQRLSSVSFSSPLAAVPFASEASTSARELHKEAASGGSWIHRAIKEHPTRGKKRPGFWTRKGPDGEPVPIPSWEKVYWGFGAVAVVLIVLPRAYVWWKTKPTEVDEEDKLRKKQEKEAKRATLLPVMATGKSFVGEEEARLFDGLTPKEINRLVAAKFGNTVTVDDPFEGLSPEEIDAMYGTPSSE